MREASDYSQVVGPAKTLLTGVLGMFVGLLACWMYLNGSNMRVLSRPNHTVRDHAPNAKQMFSLKVWPKKGGGTSGQYWLSEEEAIDLLVSSATQGSWSAQRLADFFVHSVGDPERAAWWMLLAAVNGRDESAAEFWRLVEEGSVSAKKMADRLVELANKETWLRRQDALSPFVNPPGEPNTMLRYPQ